LSNLGYSASEQAILKAILYAMEHPKAVGLIYTSGSVGSGIGFGLYQANKVPLAPDIPTINSNGINPLFDQGITIGTTIGNLIPILQDIKKWTLRWYNEKVNNIQYCNVLHIVHHHFFCCKVWWWFWENKHGLSSSFIDMARNDILYSNNFNNFNCGHVIVFICAEKK